MLTESFGRATTENHSGRDKQVPAVKDCRFTQTAFGTVVLVLVNLDILDEYLETFHIEDEEFYK